MTNTETYAAPSNANGSIAFRDAKASAESVISDAGSYAGQKGQEALDNVRAVGHSLAVAVENSVTTRPYTTLAVALAAGFLIGATWHRSK